MLTTYFLSLQDLFIFFDNYIQSVIVSYWTANSQGFYAHTWASCFYTFPISASREPVPRCFYFWEAHIYIYIYAHTYVYLYFHLWVETQGSCHTSPHFRHTQHASSLTQWAFWARGRGGGGIYFTYLFLFDRYFLSVYPLVCLYLFKIFTCLFCVCIGSLAD